MERKPIHYLKSRNSEYLAGVDLEVFELEGKTTTLTIKDVQYKENFKVNGRNKASGIVLTFTEPHSKPWIINPTQRREIKRQTGVIDLVKCIGFSLTLYVDMKVSFKVSREETIKGGVAIKSINTNGLIAPLKDVETRVKEVSNKAELMSLWNGLTEQEQITHKEIFTTKIKSL